MGRRNKLSQTPIIIFLNDSAKQSHKMQEEIQLCTNTQKVQGSDSVESVGVLFKVPFSKFV